MMVENITHFGIDELKALIKNHLWGTLSDRKHCHDCEARFVCGDECMVVSYYNQKILNSIDETMCKLKNLCLN